jgi:hypothetical protein
MIDAPRPSVAEAQRLVAAQLSVPSRLGHVLLLGASLTVATAVGSLWATEPSLPPRTHVTFALIVTAAAAWAVFAAWVLARRRVLFGAERVLAAKMGLIFAALSALGMGALGYWGGLGRGAYLGALLQTLFCGLAAVLLMRARRHVEALSQRRQELEGRIGRP